MVQRILLIGIAGGAGALSRYGLSSAMHWGFGKEMPWGTMAVNIFGCFLFGLVTILVKERLNLSDEYELILLTGFMGAFTTFSTYMFETHQLLDQGRYIHAVMNLGIQNLVGLAALIGGVAVGKALPF